MKTIELLSYQHDFLCSQKPYALLTGGIGSGKSFCGACYALMMVGQYPKAVGGIFANTYKQLRNATLRTFFKLLEANSIPYEFNKVDSIIKVNNTTIYCYSLDNYDALRGIEIGWAWMDEAAYANVEAWDVLTGRIRDKNGPLQIRVTTTPRGYNWLYSVFVDTQSGISEYFTASSMQNTFLPPDYVKTLEKTYDKKLQDQELHGRFVNVSTGRIYYNFDRISHTALTSKSSKPYISMDFNIDPMTAVVFIIEQGRMVVIDEIFLRDSNTDEMARRIKEKYGMNLEVIPDSTGKALKSSSAGRSDHDILRSHGFIVPSVRNPYRRDRYNLINKMLEDGQLIIDQRCVNLIKDLEQLSYKEGTDMPSTSDPLLSHISDALGYGAYHFFSLEAPRRETKMINIIKDGYNANLPRRSTTKPRI